MQIVSAPDSVGRSLDSIEIPERSPSKHNTLLAMRSDGEVTVERGGQSCTSAYARRKQLQRSRSINEGENITVRVTGFEFGRTCAE
jgi:hypothetical protein